MHTRTNIGNILFPCTYKKIGPGGACAYLIELLPVSELVFSLGPLLLGPATSESELKAVAVRRGSLWQEDIVIKPSFV